LGGFLLFLVGNVVNFVALQFAPQSLTAPLGAVSLITNVILAPLINKEKLSVFDVAGILLICGGSAIAIVFSGYVEPGYRLCALLNLLKRPATIAYLAIISACIVATYVFIRYTERVFGLAMGKKQAEGGEEEEEPRPRVSTTETLIDPSSGLLSPMPKKGERGVSTSFSDPYHVGGDRSAASSHLKLTSTVALIRPVSEVSTDMGVELAPLSPTIDERDVNTAIGSNTRLMPLPSNAATRYALPLAYAIMGGLMGTLTTLFAKSLINLLTTSFIDGQNQFTQFLSWVILLVTVFTAISQVFWINMGLQRYDALLQVPVFYTVWTVLDIIGGGIYYDEFRDFSTVRYVMFCLGVAVIFAGVGLLAKRLKNLEQVPSERQQQPSSLRR